MRAVVVVAMLASTAYADPTAKPKPFTPVYTQWTGTYVCAQGITAVQLSIEATKTGGKASAHFTFSADASNPHVPTGDYWLKGTLGVDAEGKLAVKLVPDRWGNHPTGYVMVGLTAASDREQRLLTGTIDFDGCSTIAVRRVVAEATQ